MDLGGWKLAHVEGKKFEIGLNKDYVGNGNRQHEGKCQKVGEAFLKLV